MKTPLALLLMEAVAFAQTAPPPAPAPAAAASPKPAAAAPKRPAAHKPHAPDITGAVVVSRQPPLPPSARLALALSENYIASAPPPVTAPDGKVLYTFGQGVPTMVCSLLEVCELDLEAGEVPNKDGLDYGDNRFNVATRTAGTGPTMFSYVVVKPTAPNLDTTMTIGTNKRAYFIRLISTEHDHIARIGFIYPDEVAAAKEQEQQLAEAKAEADAAQLVAKQQPQQEKKPAEDSRRNWHYTVKMHGKEADYLRPTSISDDGAHTYIALSEIARHRGLPTIQITDGRGMIPANTRWDGTTLVIDTVFHHGCLVSGVGRKQQRACITNTDWM